MSILHLIQECRVLISLAMLSRFLLEDSTKSIERKLIIQSLLNWVNNKLSTRILTGSYNRKPKRLGMFKLELVYSHEMNRTFFLE